MSSTDAFSILDIGRRINSLSVAYCELDHDDSAEETGESAPPSAQSAKNRARRCCRQTRMKILLSEMLLLRDLALVPQPKTLVEAAVQLALLFNSMGYELDTDDVEEMRAGFKKAHRATAGLARAVAAAAGVDLTQFGELDMVALMDSYCPPEPTEKDRVGEQADRVKW
jgi:hypothetical protein